MCQKKSVPCYARHGEPPLPYREKAGKMDIVLHVHVAVPIEVGIREVAGVAIAGRGANLRAVETVAENGVVI